MGRDASELEEEDMVFPVTLEVTMVHRWKVEDTKIVDVWLNSKEELDNFGMHTVVADNGLSDDEWEPQALQIIQDGRILREEDSDEDFEITQWPCLCRVLLTKSEAKEYDSDADGPDRIPGLASDSDLSDPFFATMAEMQGISDSDDDSDDW